MDMFSKTYTMTTVPLGEGGSGAVYLGTRLCDGKQVAVKKISNRVRFCTFHGQRVPLEIVLLNRVSSKPSSSGVIRMLDYYRVKRGWLIVMERPEESQDFYDYIDSKRCLDEESARSFLFQVIQAICHCHSRGVVHMDIKDENLVLDMKTGELKLIDFGSGDFLDADKLYTAFYGTSVYGPPERLTGGYYHALTSEVWSIGILLYDMVHGDVPFHNEDDIVRGKPVFKHDLSEGCVDLIEWCLSRTPEARPDVRDILKHPWMYERKDETQGGLAGPIV